VRLYSTLFLLCEELISQANTACDENIELSIEGQSETRTESANACTMLCSEKAGCGGFLYYKGTKACHDVNMDSLMLGTCTLPGAMFYKVASSKFYPFC